MPRPTAPETTPSSSAVRPLATGAWLHGRFELRERLGAGGMGVVYRAFDHERQVEVALKRLIKVDASLLYLFKREFRSLADVVHPNLVLLHELLSVGDDWFLTMELVVGVAFDEYVRPLSPGAPDERTVVEKAGTLAHEEVSAADATVPALPPESSRRTREPRRLGPLDEERLERTLVQLAVGVGALHQAGKLHRDLKPSNVLVRHDGHVLLCDFGLIMDVGPKDRAAEGAVQGTPAYMAPEQAAGQAVTAASDWYAVGVMLFEVLTGERPFIGSPDEMMARKQSEEAPSPQQLRSHVPRHLNDLSMHLLSRDPSRRASGQDILRVLHHEGISIPSPAAVRRDNELVGRTEQLAELEDALLFTRENHRSATVFLRGPSGMGKSALATAFLERASRSGALVLEGRCYERERRPWIASRRRGLASRALSSGAYR